MSSFTEEHQRGVRAFTESLEHTEQTCRNCGFSDVILHSEWRARVERLPQSGHLLYRLKCPNCASTEVVEINL